MALQDKELQRAEEGRAILLLLESQEGDRRTALASAVQALRGLMTLTSHSSLYEQSSSRSTFKGSFFFLAYQAITTYSSVSLAREIKAIMKSTGVMISIIDQEGEAVETTWILGTVAVEELLFGRALSERDGIRYIAPGLAIPLPNDLQSGFPPVHVSLGRAGVVGLKKAILLGEEGHQYWFPASFDLYANLSASRVGMHMSRFSDALDEAMDTLEESAWSHLDTVAEYLAKMIVEKQQVLQAEVSVHIAYPLQKWTPMSGRRTQEVYGLIAQAVATEKSCKRLIGVEVEGMVACPCAQDMIHSFARVRLQEEGFDDATIEKMLNLTPLATHNQRGHATLLLGSDQSIDPKNLVMIAEQAMSSENYALLKRPDELSIVKKAHANPRFVEDVVREMLRSVVERYPDLPDDAFVWVRQRNEETIHTYDVEAEGWGTLSELRSEILQNQQVLHHTTREEWWGA